MMYGLREGGNVYLLNEHATSPIFPGGLKNTQSDVLTDRECLPRDAVHEY